MGTSYASISLELLLFDDDSELHEVGVPTCCFFYSLLIYRGKGKEICIYRFIAYFPYIVPFSISLVWHTPNGSRTYDPGSLLSVNRSMVIIQMK